MWQLAQDSRTLDLNSSYAYLLWARDFAETSVIATTDDEPSGFVTGYRRPDAPGTLMIWQVAVAEPHRGRGLARRMLDHLAATERPRHLETTITADNQASIALFSSFATAHDATLERQPLFTAEAFPDGHSTEHLFRVGPLPNARTPETTSGDDPGAPSLDERTIVDRPTSGPPAGAPTVARSID